MLASDVCVSGIDHDLDNGFGEGLIGAALAESLGGPERVECHGVASGRHRTTR